MHVQADLVAGLVQVEALVAAVGDVLFELALEQAEPEQDLGQGLDHGLVPGLVGPALPRLRPRGGLRGADQIARASSRERVWPYGADSVVAVPLKKKHNKKK